LVEHDWWRRRLKTMNLDKLEELENKLKDVQNEHASDKSVIQKIKKKYPGYAGVLLGEDFAFQANEEGSNPFTRSKFRP
jgi:ribosomal protein L15